MKETAPDKALRIVWQQTTNLELRLITFNINSICLDAATNLPQALPPHQELSAQCDAYFQ
ncbi:hypothetical protein Hanom_Chr12g01135301 [Helianthus anomalus]